MIRSSRYANKIALVVFLLFLSVLPVFADDGEVYTEQADAMNGDSSGIESEGLDVPQEEPALDKSEVDTHVMAEVSAGYRFLSTDSFGGRAAEYEYLRSSAAGGAAFNTLGKDLKLAVDGAFQNKNDYHADLTYDYKGIYRLLARTESLFHNLDNETVTAPATIPVLGLDPTARYGIRVEQDQVRFRYKLREYPIHLNLGYWRMLKEGDYQLRFYDSFSKLTLVRRAVDRQIHEGDAGFDAHLGPLDVTYTFLIRQFDDRLATPRDSFATGILQHNEDPESRFYSHTVKLHTSLTGGIVGAASYSYGRSENRSTLSDIKRADQTRDTLQNAAGDLVYTPCRQFSLAVKYRHQEIDRDNPSTIFSSYAGNKDVRPALDSRKDVVTATASVRPLSILTINGEYKGVLLHRDNADPLGATSSTTTWKLPEDSDTHSGTITVLARPLKGLRLRALYGYTTTDHPSYGSSFEGKHEGQLLASYNGSSRWGLSANYRLTREWSDRTTASVAPTLTVFPLDRKSSHTAVNVWINPLERLTVSGGFGFLRTESDQAVLLSSTLPGSQVAANYTSQSQIYSLSSVYRLDDRLDLSLALQHVRSFSEFDPESKIVSATSSTFGIKDISRLKTIENSISARAGYQLTKNFNCTLDYTYKDYDNKVSALYEGTVHVISALLKARW